MIGTPPRVVERVKVEELPRGRVLRLLVEIGHDGMGRPMRIPVLAARGERPGPTVGITAAVHGNEVNGIPVIHRLFERLDVRALRGTVLAAVVVNTPGFLLHQREFDDGTDLNHIMPGRPDGNVAEVYVHRFLDRYVSALTHLVDLHTASFGRINSLYVRADMSDGPAADMARLLRPQIILHNPPSDRTLRGAAEEMGIPAVTVEIGNPQRFQPELIRSTLSGIRRVLASLGMVARRKFVLGEPPVLCASSTWLYTDRGGLLDVTPKLCALVEEGESVATLTDVFGDLTAELRAPSAGIVIGKSVNPVGKSGARILHLGKIAAPTAEGARRAVFHKDAS